MEKPKAPEGWSITKFNYKGELASQYERGNVVYRIERPSSTDLNDEVFLKVISLGDQQLCFNVYRQYNRTIEEWKEWAGIIDDVEAEYEPFEDSLGPKIPIVKDGIEYCVMVAEKYMDTPMRSIPGVNEMTMEALIELATKARKRGIKVLLLPED